MMGSWYREVQVEILRGVCYLYMTNKQTHEQASAMETDSTAGASTTAAAPMATDMDDEEEALLKQALAMSMADTGSEGGQAMETEEDQVRKERQGPVG